MRLVLSIPVLIMLGIGAQAMPLAPLQSVPDSPIAVQMKMGHSKMTCKQIMRMQRMHQKLAGGRLLTCKQVMRMHRKMMGGRM